MWTIAPRGYTALGPHQVVVDGRTFAKYEQFYKENHSKRRSSGSISSSSMGSAKPAPFTPFEDTATASTFYSGDTTVDMIECDIKAEELPQKGDRPKEYSAEYKLACWEFALVSSMALRQCPHAHLLIVRATLKELYAHGVIEQQPSLRDIARFVPTNYVTISDFARRVNDYTWSLEVGKMPVCFIVSDDGNSAENKNTYNQITGYCPAEHRIKKITSSAARSGNKATHIAQSIKDDGERLNVQLWGGSCTDSAATVLSGVAAEMQKDWENFLAIGCVLHILNLVLCNSYIAAFGGDAMGVLSALRLGFMVNYMMTKLPEFRESFLTYCDRNGHHDARHICAGASTTRWWSIVASFGDIYKHRAVYTAWFNFMTKTNKSPTFQPLFREVTTWLMDDKVMTDVAFILDFNEAWWVPEMDFAQGIGPWQRLLPREHQAAGYRCDEHGVRVVTMRRRMVRLAAEVQNETSPSFRRYWEWRNKLPKDPPADAMDGEDDGGIDALSDFEYSGLQADRFFETALATLGNHHRRWLVELLPLSVYHPNQELGLALADAILARYDGVGLPEVAAGRLVEIEGEGEVELAPLVSAMMQFVTSDDLQTKCALTTDASTVAELRQWVTSGGDFTSEPGKRLKLKLDTQVRGRPFHSHAAERLVGLGVRLHRKHGGHETDQHFSTRVTSKSNNTAEDVRNAACAFERKQKKEADEEKGRAGAQAPWVDDQAAEKKKKRVRPASSTHRNKEVLGLAVENFEKRASKAAGLAKAAYEHAGAASAAGVDIASRDSKRQRDQYQGLVANASERRQNPQMPQYSEEDMKKRASELVMPRVQFGIDLDTAAKKKKPTTDELISECEAREIDLPKTRNNTVRKSGNDPSGTKIDKAFFIAKLRAWNNNKRYLKRQSDETATARAWEGDDMDT